MKPTIAYNSGHGWYITSNLGNKDALYLHPDGVWRESMWNASINKYGYVLQRDNAQAILDKWINPIVVAKLYHVYDVLAVWCADHTIDTHLYYYALDTNDVWKQAFAGNSGWYVADISLVS